MPFVIDLSGAEAQLVLKLLALWVLLTGSYIGMLAVGGPQASRYAIAAACILVQTCYSPPVSMANLTGATARAGDFSGSLAAASAPVAQNCAIRAPAGSGWLGHRRRTVLDGGAIFSERVRSCECMQLCGCH
jgi:hypothetical protein